MTNKKEIEERIWKSGTIEQNAREIVFKILRKNKDDIQEAISNSIWFIKEAKDKQIEVLYSLIHNKNFNLYELEQQNKKLKEDELKFLKELYNAGFPNGSMFEDMIINRIKLKEAKK